MNTMVADALVGQTVDSRYLIETRLATGGMATVYRAIDNRLDRPVALKIMRAEFAVDPQFVRRFQQEARAAARLSHPNVVAVYDQGQCDGLVYLAMEFVAGRTLRDVLREHHQLSPAQALAVLDPVLQGLAAAHEAGFVHRDIKPENVLVPPTGPIKVTDFGLARALEQPVNATAGLLIGTAAYLAPEQVSNGHSDERGDVYQAGILLYEMLSGKLPHTGENAWSVAYSHVNDDVPALRTVAPETPESLEHLVEAATKRDPDQRIRSVNDFLARSREIANDFPAPQPFRTPPTAATTVLIPPESEVVVVTSAAADSGRPASDAEPTGGSDDQSVQGASKPPESDADRKLRQRMARRRWMIAILITLSAVAATALLAWVVATNPFNRADIPKLVGVGEAKAEKRLEAAGFVPVVVDRQFSETSAAGTVISSDPETGGGARVGSSVDLVVSMGPERYAVPPVTGLTPDEATTALEKSNLQVGAIRKVHHDEVKSGDVVRSSPKKRAKVKRDTKVKLIISKGPAPVDVPNVIGISEEFAKERMENAGLKVSTSGSEYSEAIGKGRVLETSPSPGIGAHRGDTVRFTTSKGPPPVVVPNVIDMTRSEAESRLRALGFRVEVSEGLITPLNRVFSQDPGGQTKLPKGSKVTISVF